MRRKQCQVTTGEVIEEILGRARIGRLATIGEDGFPYITPVNFVWWNDSIYFHCAREGEKIDNITRNNRVCFEIDIPLSYLGVGYDENRPTCHVHQFYHCVIIRGRAQFVDDIEEKVASLNALVSVHENGGPFTPLQEDTREVGLCTVVAVRVDSLSAKSDLGQKMSKEHRLQVASYLRERGLSGDMETARLMGENDG
ncbi:MAG TPA: pyridoxamine 5'-phosphate oxidase family protein [Desulfopila sp.]|nr:pyridoxamine 5'-phosphate oxidase family protein [Desulfopila sp.]